MNDFHYMRRKILRKRREPSGNRRICLYRHAQTVILCYIDIRLGCIYAIVLHVDRAARRGASPILNALAVLLVLGCALEAVFIVLEHKKRMLGALLLKAGASMLFVVAGFVAFSLAPNPPFGRMIVLGLMLGAIGDVCLNLRFLLPGRAKPIFLLGIGAFLLGHVAYLAALAALSPAVLLYALPAAAVLSFFLIRFVLSRVEVAGVIKIFGIVYLCVVFLMAAVALTLFASAPQSLGRAAFALGALLFALSDVLLVLNQFGKRPYPAFRAMNLSFYYLGQVFICLTIALMR